MAVNRTTQTALTIALSIFVMLAFALGVTTYLYFDKAEKAELSRAQASSEAALAETKARQTAEDMNQLREIIGVAADVPIDDIDTQLNALVTGDFAGFPADAPTYLKLLEWVRSEYRDKHTRVKTLEEEKKSLAAQKDAEVASAEKAKQDAIAAEQQAAQQRDKEKVDFDDRWKAHEAEQQKIMDARRTAEEKVRVLESIKAEIEKGLDYMPPSKQTEYRAAIEAGNERGKPSALNDALVKQLDLLRFELRGRAKEIDNLNAILTRLRVADPDLQETIAAARPSNDRIDGFKGHIVSVDPRTGTALVSCRTTAGLRPGLVLQVFPPDDPQPEFGTRKGVVEISDIEGPTLVRAVVRREDPRNPILSGDGVSSSLWSGGVEPAIVIVGYADVDSDSSSDLAALTAIVERAGGKIVDAVAPNTALVVDLGQPPSGQDGRDVPGWPAEAKRRTRNLDSARTYNIRVTGIDGMLDMLGLDAESFRPGRLPKARGGVGRLPGR